MTDGLSRDCAAIAAMSAVPSILEVLCRVTGMGFAAIARVTEERWVACAVRDEIGFGLSAGDELDVRTTICDEVRGHRQSIVIEHVAEDPLYRDHTTPARYGFQSYIAVPILCDGQFFGSLFALDTAPAKIANSTAVTTFNLFAQLIALQLSADSRNCGG